MVASFFKPFVEEARALNHSGFQWLRKGCCITSNVYCSICSCDSIARAMLQNVKQFNGKFRCNWCLHPGCRIEKGIGSVNTYSSQVEGTMRTHSGMAESAWKALNGSDIERVRGPSANFLCPILML